MGLELALAYRRFGSAVTVVETGKAAGPCRPGTGRHRPAPSRRRGVVLHEDASVVAVQAARKYRRRPPSLGGESVTLDVSHILVAGTRVANLDDLRLPAARVRRAKLDPAALALSAAFRTSNPASFAIGEAAGRPPMPHLAAIEADLVVRAAILGQQVRIDAAAMPWLTLTDPELAGNRAHRADGAAAIQSASPCFCLGTTKRQGPRPPRRVSASSSSSSAPCGKILGAGVVGRDAGEVLALFALAMRRGSPWPGWRALPAAHASHARSRPRPRGRGCNRQSATRQERWRPGT